MDVLKFLAGAARLALVSEMQGVRPYQGYDELSITTSINHKALHRFTGPPKPFFGRPDPCSSHLSEHECEYRIEQPVFRPATARG